MQDFYNNPVDFSVDDPPGSVTGSGYISLLCFAHETRLLIAGFSTGDFYLTTLGAFLPPSVTGSQLPTEFSGVTFYLGSEGTYSFGQLKAFSGSATIDAGAAPEPATWSMMIAGFGLAGGALRRRRAEAAIA